MTQLDDPAPEAQSSGARTIAYLRHVLVFQGKLLIDGARDALLIPASLGAAVIDLLCGHTEHRGMFARVLAWGRRSERFINLFGPPAGVPHTRPADPGMDLDGALAALEAQLRDPARRAQLTETARRRLEATLRAISQAGRNTPRPGE